MDKRKKSVIQTLMMPLSLPFGLTFRVEILEIEGLHDLLFDRCKYLLILTKFVGIENRLTSRKLLDSRP